MEEQNVRGERKKKEKEKSVGERSGSNVRGIVFPQLSLGKGKGKLAVDRIDVSSAKRVLATGYFYRNSRRM